MKNESVFLRVRLFVVESIITNVIVSIVHAT